MLSLLKRPAAISDHRAALHAEIADRDAAKSAVADSRELVERLSAVIQASHDATRLAAKAAVEAREARQRWVRDGCVANARELQLLDDAAAATARASENAALNGKAASRELASAESAARSRQFSLEASEKGISTAIGLILASEALPLLERFERIAVEYRAVRSEIIALMHMIDPEYGDKSAASLPGAQVVSDALTRAKIKNFDAERANHRASDRLEGTNYEEKWFAALTAPWRARAAQLRADPDSEI